MKAAVYAKTGIIKEVIQIREVNKPVLSNGQVLVQIYAAGMNPVNYKLVEGRLGIATPSLPAIDGLDYSGVVIQVGNGCSNRLKVGDAVWGKANVTNRGTFAEYCALPENCCYKKPDEISHAEAASQGVVALTGYQALINSANLQKGQKVLVLAGSGGTGSFGIQLAKNIIGAYVATTCSTRNVEYVTSLGADRVIDYRNENWEEVLAGENYDVIYDCVGGETHWQGAQRVLKPGGYFVTIAGDHSDTPFLTFGNALSLVGSVAARKFKSLFGGLNYDYAMPKPTLKQYEDLTNWMVEKKIRVVIDKTFSLDEIVEAYEYQKSARAVGKIVVEINKE